MGWVEKDRLEAWVAATISGRKDRSPLLRLGDKWKLMSRSQRLRGLRPEYLASKGRRKVKEATSWSQNIGFKMF